MKNTTYLCFFLTLLFHSNLFAQGAAVDEQLLVRDLRIIIAGNRPMPVFKTVGEKVIEVDPPLSKLPPNVFSFADPRYAPKVAGRNGVAKRKVEYSAWPNNAITVKKYKGPQMLKLNLSRPLVEGQKAKQLVTCDLKNYLKPVIIIYADGSSNGWEDPQVKIIDLARSKSVTVMNISNLTVDVYFSKKVTRVLDKAIKNVKLPANKNNSYRYKMQAFKGKKKVVVANSSYTIRKNTKLVAILLPGIKIKASRLPRPTLRMIPMSL